MNLWRMVAIFQMLLMNPGKESEWALLVQTLMAYTLRLTCCLGGLFDAIDVLDLS